ncbi:MAG: polyphosphate kinase 1 [Acidimicrobiia bacterium]|nr:polyphosphate kinase 1 [Acidimicrobiia bacterium]
MVDNGSRHTDERLLNRELSWLDFNARVLALAADERVPLLERVKFLAIFSQNLDEFFQVRVAGLKDQLAAGLTTTTPEGRTAAQQLGAIRERALDLVTEQERIFLTEVAPALAAAGIVFSSWSQLDDDDVKHLEQVFEARIFPVLTPLAVDPSHPFPYISHMSLSLGVLVRDPVVDERRFARLKLPTNLPRFVVMPDGERFVPLEQVIAAHLDQLFPGMEVVDHFAFRVTRNADLTLEEEEADDLLAAVEMELRRRRFRRAVRLEIDSTADEATRSLLQRELDLEDDDLYRFAGPLDLGGLWAVHDLDRPDLKDPPFTPVTPLQVGLGDDDDRAVELPDVFRVLRAGDVLVHHPYDSFSATIEEFIRQAALDPRVLAIKLTLYRTSGDSPIVKSLIRAAERGKQVAALVELKARGDEQRNIDWARRLEEAGVHVVYGLVGLKIHTKTCLVVRDDPDGIRRYCHIGTGNYNNRTARLYEDLGLLTADVEIGSDLTHLFNYLTGYARDVRYRRLVVAPHELRGHLRELVEGEARLGASGRIILKMNSLVDPELIEALYAASAEGVSIDLVVRGICCLRPGVDGLSEHIRVRSIVGRYLEHSRIYFFANGVAPGVPTYLIGSADWMPRNLDGRVEALVPVLEAALQGRVHEVLDVNLADDVLAWELGPDATWRRVAGADDDEAVDTHLRLQALAATRVAAGSR